ncbi:hypothetical protein AB1N83_010064 [Pleurotus pulmonarius]
MVEEHWRNLDYSDCTQIVLPLGETKRDEKAEDVPTIPLYILTVSMTGAQSTSIQIINTCLAYHMRAVS